MTELHCVNTHTAPADRAVAAALPPAQQWSSTILAPHPPSHPLSALSFTTPQCQGTASCRPDQSLSFTPCPESASEFREKVLTRPWCQQSSRIPALQVRVDNVMVHFLNVAQTHEPTVLLKMSKRRGWRQRLQVHVPQIFHSIWHTRSSFSSAHAGDIETLLEYMLFQPVLQLCNQITSYTHFIFLSLHNTCQMQNLWKTEGWWTSATAC